MNIPAELTKCAPCAKGGMTRLAIDVVDEVPVCGPCGYDKRQHKLLARLEAEEAAKVRRPGIRVPEMPPIKGDACCWGCKPEAVEPECGVHGRIYA